MSPAADAARSASDMAQATQVAPEPARRGWRAEASPPAGRAATGRPASSREKASGPRFEATISSAPGTFGTLQARRAGDGHDGPYARCRPGRTPHGGGPRQAPG